MTQPFRERIKFLAFRPSRSCSGPSDGTIWRGENLIPRGQSEPYWENIKSRKDTALSAPSLGLTGTHGTTADSNIITGTGTAYLTELMRADFVILNNRLVRVRRVIDDTNFEGSVTWTGTTSGLTGTIPARLRVLKEQRYTFNRGSLVRLPLGHLMGVGAGVVRREGAVLPGTGLTLEITPKLALLSGGNYTEVEFGLTQPAIGDFSVTEVAGGTRNLPVGDYVIWIAPMRNNPFSYTQATGPIPVSITSAGNKIQITSGPVLDVAHGQTGWMVFVPPTDSPAGPWFYLGNEITAFPASFDWYTAEVEANEALEFDNDPVPAAVWLTTTLNGRPVAYGCNGDGNTAPGPVVRPSKRSNLEAWPNRYAVALPDDVIGVVSGEGRDYAMTGSTLHIAAPSGDPDLPVTVRPFWDVGFHHPDQLVFVNGELYGCTKGGPRRSSSDGVPGSQQYEFAEDVGEIFNRWNLEHVVVVEDAINEAVVYFHPSPNLDPIGRGHIEALMFMLRQQRWSTLIMIEDEDFNLVVSSAAKGSTVTSFIANEKIYEYANGEEAVSWNTASPLLNLGSEETRKYLDTISVLARTTDGKVGIFGYGDDQDLPTMEDVASLSLTGAIALDDSAVCRRSETEPINLSELRGFGVRVEGEYAGTGVPNRVDDVLVIGRLEGVAR